MRDSTEFIEAQPAYTSIRQADSSPIRLAYQSPSKRSDESVFRL